MRCLTSTSVVEASEPHPCERARRVLRAVRRRAFDYDEQGRGEQVARVIARCKRILAATWGRTTDNVGYYFVGCVGAKRTVFNSVRTPTWESHGHLYNAVIGPFYTRMGAAFMAKHGQNNPHCQCVADAERLARQTKGQT